MEFISSVKTIKQNMPEYKRWEKQQQDLDAKRAYLTNHVSVDSEEVKDAYEKGQAVLNAIDIMDHYSQQKAENTKTLTKSIRGIVIYSATGIGAGVGYIVDQIPFVKNIGKGLTKAFASSPVKYLKNKADIIGPKVLPVGFGVIVTAGAIISSIVIAKDLKKEASKIARYESKEKELKDPRSFARFTLEQIEKAKQIATTMPESNNQHLLKKLNPLESFNEVMNLYKDQRDYKKWLAENKNEHLKNEKLFNKKIPKELLLTAKRDKDVLFNIVRKVNIKSKEYSENIETAATVASLLYGTGGFGLGFAADKLKKTLKVSSHSFLGRHLGVILGGIAGFIGIAYSAKIQVEGAKLGRFMTKKEILKDPNSFIYYTDEQIDTAKDVTGKDNKTGFWDSLKFYFDLPKQYRELKEYEDTQEKDDIKYRKALLKIDISEKQLREAKKLQKNTFKIFDKVDEMSLKYAEDAEGAVEIMLAPLIIGGPLVGVALGSKLAKVMKNPLAFALGPLACVTPSILLSVWGSNLKVKSAKLSNILALKELSDPREFVGDEEFETDSNDYSSINRFRDNSKLFSKSIISTFSKFLYK